MAGRSWHPAHLTRDQRCHRRGGRHLRMGPSWRRSHLRARSMMRLCRFAAGVFFSDFMACPEQWFVFRKLLQGSLGFARTTAFHCEVSDSERGRVVATDITVYSSFCWFFVLFLTKKCHLEARVKKNLPPETFGRSGF